MRSGYIAQVCDGEERGCRDVLLMQYEKSRCVIGSDIARIICLINSSIESQIV